MAAYAALASLSKTTLLNTNQPKFPFSIDAEEKIRSIHEYVIFLLSFLEDFPQKSNCWEGKMRDVAHETQDLIEHFMWRQSYYRRMKLSSVEFEDQLRQVTEKFCLMAGDMMDERPTLSSSSSSSRLAPSGNGGVVGLESDLMEIKNRLCGLSSKLQLIPIVGMGGIGKTTLARTAYDDPLITGHFYIRVWLTISQDYSAHNTLLGLLHSMKLIGEQMSREVIDDVSTMREKVYKNLKGRRYLIVIDDVWSTNVWDDVRNIFPDDCNGSRIMLTTRLWDLATYPDSNSPPHEMRFMNDSQSWDLLKEKVFTNDYCPPDLEDVGKEIARRCAGLPLVLVLVAGVLSPVNKTRASWEEFAKNVNPVVDWELEEILSLSYTYLPHHLRPCFLFIGGFLEDVNIRSSRLIRLWVAEGFLKHQNGCSKSLEEVAEEYLEDLVKRNLVIVTSRKSNGRIKSCSLHDMVRDLCIRKAHQEKFLLVMDGRDLAQGSMDERRISFSRSDIDKIWGPTFRTILCFQSQMLPNWLASLDSYKLLTILDVLGVDLKELHSKVFELYHLRYLALMGSFCIPSAISNLVNLQTLIIHLRYGKLRGKYDDGVPHSLPLEIWRLPQLRHLFFHAPYTLHHPQEGLSLHLENLQTLLVVTNLVWNEKILQFIPNVKRLGLAYTTNEEYHLHHLKHLHQLEKLEVIGYQGFSWRGQNPCFPCTLKKLTLIGGGFPWEDMAIVGSLPNLEVLKLLGNACNGEAWETTDEDFPRLKVLLIDDSHLEQWITQSNPLPMLKHLVLRSCRYLWEIPEGIGKIPTLELIDVNGCNFFLVISAKKIKEDQESYGNYALQVRVGREEIQSFYERMDLSPSSPVTSSNDAVIGLDEDLMEIKEQLCGQSSELLVVPIVGMDGMGKTTLVRTAYYDPLILEHFDVRIWLTLFRDSSPPLFVGILSGCLLWGEQMSGGKIVEYEMLIKICKKFMVRRYLVVLDGVQSIEVWDAFKNIFPNYLNGSRIMLTTRLAHVGCYANSGPFLHYMQLMDENQSWDLLKKAMFENGNCPPELEDIGKEIAERCGGLWLAVLLIAGILSAVDTTRASWNEILISISKHQDVDFRLQEILSFSYRQLPHYLRPCFRRMGFLLLKYQNIHALKLLKLWVDEGFLKHETGCSESLEEKAEEYLEDLVKRNLVTVLSRENNAKIKSCNLPHMVRDFCLRKALEE